MEFFVSFHYQTGEELSEVPLLELKLANHQEIKSSRRVWTTCCAPFADETTSPT